MPVIEENGYEYVGTEFNRTGGTNELIIYADKPGGLGLDDCERISRLIDPIIDEKDPIEESYCLCVSSPGLDRPLKTPRDFARSMGKVVDLRLYRPADGKKEWTGTLKDYNQEHVVIGAESGDKSFDNKDVAIIRLHVDITFGR